MSKIQLFNKDVFMPEIALPVAIRLRYSNHALRAANNDRYGIIRLPRVLVTKDATLVELELTDGAPTKAVFRLRHSAGTDLVLVVNPDGFVRTVWLNMVSDKHRTLDVSKFCKAV